MTTLAHATEQGIHILHPDGRYEFLAEPEQEWTSQKIRNFRPPTAYRVAKALKINARTIRAVRELPKGSDD